MHLRSSALLSNTAGEAHLLSHYYTRCTSEVMSQQCYGNVIIIVDFGWL